MNNLCENCKVELVKSESHYTCNICGLEHDRILVKEEWKDNLYWNKKEDKMDVVHRKMDIKGEILLQKIGALKTKLAGVELFG